MVYGTSRYAPNSIRPARGTFAPRPTKVKPAFSMTRIEGVFVSCTFWYLVQETNTPSIRVIEKAGFTLVGRGANRRGVRLLHQIPERAPLAMQQRHGGLDGAGREM